MSVLGHYRCSDCGRLIKKGDFIAIVGKAPPESQSMPVGRADTIFKQMGDSYCDECFLKRFIRK
jgi:hypothetical protein